MIELGDSLPGRSWLFSSEPAGSWSDLSCQEKAKPKELFQGTDCTEYHGMDIQAVFGLVSTSTF